MVGPVAEGRGQRHRPRAADRAVRAAVHATRRRRVRRWRARGGTSRRGPPSASVRRRWRSPTPHTDAPTDGGDDVLEVRGDVGWTAWISCAGSLPWGQPDDQRPDEAYSLTYTWPALEHDLEILGHARLTVSLTSSAPIAYLSAKLCDVFPDGASSLVTRNILNLAHRDSREEPSPLEPGHRYEVTIELEAASWTFEAGHRIRLDLAGTDWPNVWSPPEPVTLTIDRSATTLTLPVLDGPSPAEGTPAFAPPRRESSVPNRGSGGYDWKIEHDVPTAETRAVVANYGDYPAKDDTASFAERYEGVVTVRPEDPGIAAAHGAATFEMRWPEATCGSQRHGRHRERPRHVPGADRPPRHGRRRRALAPDLGSDDPPGPAVGATAVTLAPGYAKPRRAGRGNGLDGISRGRVYHSVSPARIGSAVSASSSRLPIRRRRSTRSGRGHPGHIESGMRLPGQPFDVCSSLRTNRLHRGSLLPGPAIGVPPPSRSFPSA